MKKSHKASPPPSQLLSMPHHNTKHTLLLTLLSLATVLTLQQVHAQSPAATIATYLNAVRQNQHPTTPKQLWQDAEQHNEVLSALQPYYTDTLPGVRAQAYFLTKQVGTNSQDPTIRQSAVSQLITGLQDEDSGNIGRVHTYLSASDPADFTASSQQAVADLLSQNPPHFSRLLKLVGSLGMTDQLVPLQNLLPELSGRDRWAAQLALARLGDQEALASVLARAKRYPVNDDVVYELLPDLIYTRQKEAIDYLVTIVQSDEKNCEPADPDASENILCGYRVLELLAPVIQDFPLTVDASGDLAVSDYPKALQQARQWFGQHTDYRVMP